MFKLDFQGNLNNLSNTTKGKAQENSLKTNAETVCRRKLSAKTQREESPNPEKLPFRYFGAKIV